MMRSRLNKVLIFLTFVCLLSVNASPLRRRILFRKFSLERRKEQRRFVSSQAKHGSTREGTCLRWSLPTVDRATKWFSARSLTFNHKAVGMTNPSLHIAFNEHNEAVIQASAKTRLGDEVEWWPQAAVTDKSWKMKRYRRRLGSGTAIYEAVRDACLDWEFQSKGRGIVQVKSTTEPRSFHRRESRGVYEVVHTGIDGDGDMMCTPDSCRQIGSGRRLATYTETSLKLKWLPRIFIVNPVMVVYDLVDQRAAGTTYTSTAYATMKGHWLSGEERLTVAHRDGSGNVDLELLSYSRPAASLIGRLVWPFVGPFQTKFFVDQMDSLEQVAHSISRPRTIPRLQEFNDS